MIETSLVLLAGVSIYFMATEVVKRWPPAGLALVFSALTLSWHISTWTPFASLFGLSINFPDFIVVVLLGATVLTVGEYVKLKVSMKVALHFLLLIMALSVIRGTVAFGLAPAINEFRAWLYILTTAAWVYVVLSTRPLAPVWFEKWVLYSAVAVSAVGVLNTAVYGFGGANSSNRSADGAILEAGRPIASGQAVILAIAAILCLWRWKQSSRSGYLSLAMTFCIFVILAQHRSVWIALGTGLIVSVLFLQTSERMITMGMVLSVCIGGWIALKFFGNSQAVTIFSSSAEDSRTYDGRVYDWRVLIDDSFTSGGNTVFFGSPFGSGWWRYREDGLRIGYIPHNWYVATYLRVGVIGLTAMLAFMLAVLVQVWHVRAKSPLLAIAVIICVYCWAYNLQWYLAPIVGWIVWSARMTWESRIDGKREPIKTSSTDIRFAVKSNPGSQ